MAQQEPQVNPEAPVWPDVLSDLLQDYELDPRVTAWAMDQIMTDAASPVQMAGFLIGMRAKGETAAEVTGLVEAMLSHARRIEVPGPAVDVVGTGGDRSNSVNISTMSAIAAASTCSSNSRHGGNVDGV